MTDRKKKKDRQKEKEKKEREKERMKERKNERMKEWKKERKQERKEEESKIVRSASLLFRLKHRWKSVGMKMEEISDAKLNKMEDDSVSEA